MNHHGEKYWHTSDCSQLDRTLLDYSRVVVLAPECIHVLLLGLRSKSAEPLTSAGFVVEGTTSGSASKLSQLLTSDSSIAATGCILQLCGDKALDVVATSCAAAGLPLRPLVVYESTYSHTDITSSLQASTVALLEAPMCSFDVSFVFFSPGGVTAVLKHSPLVAALAASGQVGCVAIGPTTADALKMSGIPDAVIRVAASPNAEGVCTALLALLAE